MENSFAAFSSASYGDEAFKLLIGKINSLAQLPKILLFSGIGATSKTYCAKRFVEHWPSGSANIIELDSFLRSRSQRRQMRLTGMNIASYDIEAFSEAIKVALDGQIVTIPYYDHKNGHQCLDCDDPLHRHKLYPAKRLIVVGAPIQKSQFSWLKPDFFAFFQFSNRQTAKLVRIMRDVNMRNRSYKQAQVEFAVLWREYQTFLLPSRKMSNCVIEVRSLKTVSLWTEGEINA